METNKPMTKVEALRKTIYNLENNVYEYNWSKSESCNCGVLARTILGGKNVWDAGFGDSPQIKYGSQYQAFCSYAYCITTNLELPEVFKALKDAGFSINELNHLENLNDTAILKRGDVKYFFCNDGCNSYMGDKVELIKYLKAWVEIIEEETQPKIQPTHKDITSELAVLPINETSDLIVTKELITN